MNHMYAVAVGLVSVLTATTAHATPPREEIQAPRSQEEVQAPRSEHDVQAPRGEDKVEAPRQ